MLETPPGELSVQIQRVDHESRVHIDIETDDIRAEVARLENLGAIVDTRMERWVVMRAPSGQRFCVVRVQRAGFGDNATTWDGAARNVTGQQELTSPTVLAIGLDPKSVDYSAMPQLTPELVRSYIEAEIGRVRNAGFDVHTCLLKPDSTASATVEAALQSKRFACVVIGAGLREPPEHLFLFEQILNLVHRLAPDARIAFNSTPADSAEAVQRWVVAR
jgi:hypothetical protein